MLTIELNNSPQKVLMWETIKRKYHRERRPAFISYWANGRLFVISYFRQGVYHRNIDEGPAEQKWYPSGQKYLKSYYVNGLSHHPTSAATTLWDEHTGAIIRKLYFINNYLQPRKSDVDD